MAEPVRYRFFTVEDFAPNLYTIVARRDRAIIGRIEWYARWGEFVLCPDEHTVWSAGCLRDVQDFIAKHAKHERSKP